jgi:hypothetical protein
MCCLTTITIEPKDFLILIFGFLLSGLWPVILYLLKPNLKIMFVEKKIEEDKSVLKIKVNNNGCSNAVNLKFEVCVVDYNYTYHLESDRDEFLILPFCKNKKLNDSDRDFKIRDLSTSAKHYHVEYESLINALTQSDSNLSLRVRVHACHGYSGFGKVFQQSFKYLDGKFIKI